MPQIDDTVLIMLALLCAAAAWRKAHRLVAPSLSAAVFVVSLQEWRTGYHWQIVPAYVAIAIGLLVVWLPRSTGRRWLAGLALLLTLTSIAALIVFPMFTLPKPTGSYAVGTTGPLHWTDPARGRQLELQIWYPASTDAYEPKARYARRRELSPLRSYMAAIETNSGLGPPIADAAAPYPVLIFGHRWGGSRTQDTFLVEDLASHGYVVVAVDHPLNAARVEMADGSVVLSDRAGDLGNLDAKTAASVEAEWARELAIWTADNRFVLDRMQQTNAGQFQAKLDFSRVGAFGHSFGGAASMALLGVDDRVKCAVNLDGWTFNAMHTRTTQPVLIVYEGVSEHPHPEQGTEAALDGNDRLAVSASLAKYGGLEAFVAGTQHLDFTDQALYSPFQRLTSTGPIAGTRVREITRTLVLAFFDQHLRGQPKTTPTYPEVHLHQ